MTKINYRNEYKQAKNQISELQNQISTLKDRLDVLRKAKNQTILKTEIVNRSIAEPVFGQVPLTNDNIHSERQVTTRDVGLNTDPIKVEAPPPPPPPPTKVASPKRTQRKRVKENWSQCVIFTANKVSQASFVQTCHCEGVNESDSSPLPKANSPITNTKTPVTFPKIPHPTNNVGVRSNVSTPTSIGEIRTISRMKTKDYISSDSHAAEIAALESAFKVEREKLLNIHSREVAALKQTIESLTVSLKAAVEENVKQTLNAPNGASVFHLYAEEKKRMEDQVSAMNLCLVEYPLTQIHHGM